MRREVQAGGGRGHGAAFAGVDGLVALAIAVRIVAADVGRQWGVADAVEDGEEIVDRVEAEQALAEVVAFEDFGFERDCAGGRGKDENFADAYFSAGMDEGAPEIFAGAAR